MASFSSRDISNSLVRPLMIYKYIRHTCNIRNTTNNNVWTTYKQFIITIHNVVVIIVLIIIRGDYMYNGCILTSSLSLSLCFNFLSSASSRRISSLNDWAPTLRSLIRCSNEIFSIRIVSNADLHFSASNRKFSLADSILWSLWTFI